MSMRGMRIVGTTIDTTIIVAGTTVADPLRLTHSTVELEARAAAQQQRQRHFGRTEGSGIGLTHGTRKSLVGGIRVSTVTTPGTISYEN